MGNFSVSGLDVVAIVFLALSFYFTLSFLKELKGDDERVIKQTKLAAVFSFIIALIIIFAMMS